MTPFQSYDSRPWSQSNITLFITLFNNLNFALSPICWHATTKQIVPQIRFILKRNLINVNKYTKACLKFQRWPLFLQIITDFLNLIVSLTTASAILSHMVSHFTTCHASSTFICYHPFLFKLQPIVFIGFSSCNHSFQVATIYFLSSWQHAPPPFPFQHTTTVNHIVLFNFIQLYAHFTRNICSPSTIRRCAPITTHTTSRKDIMYFPQCIASSSTVCSGDHVDYIRDWQNMAQN